MSKVILGNTVPLRLQSTSTVRRPSSATSVTSTTPSGRRWGRARGVFSEWEWAKWAFHPPALPIFWDQNKKTKKWKTGEKRGNVKLVGIGNDVTYLTNVGHT